MSIEVQSTEIEGVLIIEPEKSGDMRGSQTTGYQAATYAAHGITTRYVTDQYIRSFKGVLRGLTYQKSGQKAELFTVIRGHVHLVAVDVRQQSKTFGKWIAIDINEAHNRQVYLSPGIAFGYCTLSDTADIHVKQSCFADAHDDAGIFWNDADLNIDWPLTCPLVSDQENNYPQLRDISEAALPYYMGNKVFA